MCWYCDVIPVYLSCTPMSRYYSLEALIWVNQPLVCGYSSSVMLVCCLFIYKPVLPAIEGKCV